MLGASGDLTARLLLPGLGQLLTSSGGDTDVALIGSAGADWDDARWRAVVADAFAAGGADGAPAAAVARNARYLRADATREDDLRRLLQACGGRVVIYFALPPAVTAQACAALATLSVRGDTAEQCWRIVEPVLQAWRAGDVPLQEYPAGSAGPEDSLLPRRFPHR